MLVAAQTVVEGGPNWAEIATAVGTGLIALGVLLAWYQIRQEKRSRHATLATDMSRRWDEDGLLHVRRYITRHEYDATQLRNLLRSTRDIDPRYWMLQKLPNFFEDLAVLWRRRCLEIELIEESLGMSVIWYWNLWYLAVADRRDGFGRDDDEKFPAEYENFQRLAEEVAKRYLNALRKAKKKGTPLVEMPSELPLSLQD